jgi:F0F1-type ATP synthase assembly protein I
MAITLMHMVIYMWLGMAAAMLTVLQVSYSRSKHARANKERAASHPPGDAR